MTKRHMDEEVEKAIITLDDAICTWERTTGKGYTLVLVPHQREEKIHASVDGKPVSPRARTRDLVMRALLLRGS